MERRDFLVALPLLLAARPAPRPGRVLGIARGAGAVGSAAARGVQFGVHEAARTVELLGRELQWLERTGEDAAGRLAAEGAELIVALGESGPAAGVPVLRVPLGEDGDGCAADDWHVAPSPGQREEVLAAYRAGHPAAAASLRVLAWTPALERYGAQQLNDRFSAFAAAPMSEAAWLGWIAARIALECALRGEAAAQLRSPRFAIDGHKGAALRFDPATRRLQQPLYIVDPARPADPPLAELTPAAVAGICQRASE